MPINRSTKAKARGHFGGISFALICGATVSGNTHKHKSFWPVTVRWGGSLPVRCPGVKDLCASFGTQGTEVFLSGYPTEKTGDRGDRTEFYVLEFYVPFLLPTVLPKCADLACILRTGKSCRVWEGNCVWTSFEQLMRLLAPSTG